MMSGFMDGCSEEQVERPLRTYLAGGLRGGWQDAWILAHPGEDYFDPRTIQHLSMSEITTVEKRELRHCDEVYAYLEADNPSGIGLAFECGYAVALGKPVTLLDEKNIDWLRAAVMPLNS
jgi:hypothetical protein